MSVQILSAKSTRRLARELGEPTITRAWVNNDVSHAVVLYATWDHLHGYYDRRTGERGGPARDPWHVDACYGEAGELLMELDPFDDDGRWPTLND